METLTDKLKRAAALQKSIDVTKPLKKELDALKFEIQMDMTALKTSKMDPVDGYYALKVITSTRSIVDEESIKDWIADNDKSVQDYMTLNKTKVLELADEVMAEDGEILPGLEVSDVERVDIKPVKGRK